MPRFVPLDLLPALQCAISQELRSSSWARRRDCLAVAIGLHGLRVGEVCRARFEHLWIAGRILHVPPFKRGHARAVPLHHSLVTALLDWRADCPCPWLLFTRTGAKVHRTQFERAATRLTRQVLGEPLKFHALRHTFATRLYHDTNDPLLVKQLLGHRSLKSTEVYAESLASVPDACLIQLDRDEPTNIDVRPQLKLYCPAG